VNRQSIISSVYKGAALMPRWIANPGTFGYGGQVFAKAYASSPVLTQNLAQAKKLVSQAGATGQTITIGMSSQLSDIAAVAGAYQSAAQAIGLKAKLYSVSAQNYINFFTDPKARAGVDGFLTINYGDYADPAALLSTIVLPADPAQRASLVAQAEQLAAKNLPWIPDVQPTSVLITSKNLTGAVASFAYMFAPWADSLGGTG
jgi:peptide/nickel transport system substrate-binding protein